MNYGNIIELGRHRLMCGDATNAGDVNALLGGRKVDLVLTDPPYGINIQNKDGTIHGGNKSSRYLHYPRMIGDDDCQCARDNYNIVKDFCGNLIFWGANNFCDALPPSNGWLVWDKRIRLKNSYSHCELAWTNVCGNTRLYSQLWSGCFREGDYTLNPRPRVHVCQKPVELHVNILEDFSQPDDVILDCFGGSGTTLIAAEVSGRTCLMMELSPEYCGVIIDRYNKLTQGTFDFRS